MTGFKTKGDKIAGVPTCKNVVIKIFYEKSFLWQLHKQINFFIYFDKLYIHENLTLELSQFNNESAFDEYNEMRLLQEEYPNLWK